MIISCNLFFISYDYLYSILQSTINDHSFLSRHMLLAEVADRELSFAHKMRPEFIDSDNFAIKAHVAFKS